MVRQLHDGMMARITDNGAVSEAFAMTNGVKQGCNLAPTLFSLILSAMLLDAYRDVRPGIRIAYRTDGQLLNLRRMHVQSRVPTTTVHGLLFAADCVLRATSEVDKQESMDPFAAACETLACCKWWTTSRIWAELSPAPPKSKMEWPTGSPNSADPSAICKAQSGIATVSTSTPN
nr:unnamed protein product [Spirometra erinaceieuropaei]